MNSFLFSTPTETLDYIGCHSDLSFIIFAGIPLIKSLSTTVGENVILCSTSGEFSPKGYKDNVITGFSYDSEITEIVEIMYPPAKSLNKLKKSYEKVKNNPNAFTLLLCDGLAAMEESIITTFYFADPNFKIIGGSAGDNLKFEKTLIYIGKKEVHSVAVFFDMKKRTQLIKENIYIPSGKKLLVTDADPIKRTVKTFNNNLATVEYAKMLGIKEVDLPNHFKNNPLGKVSKDKVYIASPMKVNPDKSIVFYCQILPNTFVEVLQPANYNSVMKETVKSAVFKPSFVLSINCILRSLMFLDKNLWGNVSSNLLSLCENQTGFVSYGEQFYQNHFNQTMVLLLVE
ncbi:FIST signal transduction protein [Clostridium estertheticum]|uniref:FIST domain-containing protein n=1 Tax=Clostridium estertheticum subsp. estertheticum TaxID=1552 RepID=A0A1J0GDI6_9CLOT|nr:FIST N-terminal domain-containing protein [Clostridium estertheticum]APC39367.1 hypothetical protein A7L45_04475 [Clostridium estertheticum subsp. estertheticum]MBZ9614617.1 FIST C-terminal domain-containing protein [Clostridium estertheticum subsp. laramiense]WAG74542.1 FIST C-terminal domain-containing protein [Clostridium estertheticum]